MTTHTPTARRPTIGVLAFIASLIAALALGTTANAQDADTGFARFGHFAPSVEAVNVFVDGEPFADGIDFKSVSAYVEVPAGIRLFELRLATDPEGPVALAIEANVPAGGAVTIGAVTTRDGVAPQVYDDDLTSPTPGNSSVRFIHAAPDAASVDIQIAGGDPLVTDVPYPTASAYVDIEAGTYDVTVTDSESGDTLLEVAGWTISGGEKSTIIVVRSTDGLLDVAPVVDAVGMSLAPTGGVATGFGGMADVIGTPSTATSTSTSTATSIVFMMLGLAAAGLGGVIWRRTNP